MSKFRFTDQYGSTFEAEWTTNRGSILLSVEDVGSGQCFAVELPQMERLALAQFLANPPGPGASEKP